MLIAVIIVFAGAYIGIALLFGVLAYFAFVYEAAETGRPRQRLKWLLLSALYGLAWPLIAFNRN